MMLPTTLSMATVPVVSTLPISTQTHLHLQAPPGGMCGIFCSLWVSWNILCAASYYLQQAFSTKVQLAFVD